MAQVRVLLLRAPGTNCDREAQYAWERVGAVVTPLHIEELSAALGRLHEYQVITLPGGFSYGDDVAAGRIFATRLERYAGEALREFVAAGGSILGICNGFQVLARLGLVPFADEAGGPTCTVTFNAPAGFQDRWLTVEARHDRCLFLESGRRYEMPIAHGEGRVVLRDDAVRERVRAAGLDVLHYVSGETDAHGPPNPNGSELDAAGLCDETGRVFGLMPHPERFIDWTQHPAWTSQPARAEGDGIGVFRTAVKRLR